MDASAPLVVCVDVDYRRRCRSVAEAAGWMARMHGAYRVPTLLKRVDRLGRSTAA
jgi:hypothetical protein